jgi:hypothetical protein
MITKSYSIVYHADGPNGEHYRIWRDDSKFFAEVYVDGTYVFDLELSKLLSTLPEVDALIYLDTWDISQTEQVIVSRNAIKAVIEYLWHSEEKDYDESGKPENHIFHSIKELAEVLHDETK